MGIFFIELIPRIFEFNHFSYDCENDHVMKHTRFITFEGEPSYEFVAGEDGFLEENGETIEFPDLVSVIIRDNHGDKKLSQCRYFRGNIEDEFNIKHKRKFEVAIDYQDSEFETIWNMISNSKCGELTIMAGINIPDMGNDEFAKIIKIDGDKEWGLESFSVVHKRKNKKST